MKKKMKRMMDGGNVAATTAAPGKAKNPAKRAEQMAMREGQMKSRIMDKFNRISSRFPNYKPTLASPVDTREEMKAFRMGLKDYRAANPGIRPFKPATPVRGGGGVPVQGPSGKTVKPSRPGKKTMAAAMRGGGLARKGVGMALAAGGIVKAPARSYKDMWAGAGSGVGRIQKTKIAGRGR